MPRREKFHREGRRKGAVIQTKLKKLLLSSSPCEPFSGRLY
jgi:hypothetical protein